MKKKGLGKKYQPELPVVKAKSSDSKLPTAGHLYGVEVLQS